MENNQSYSKEEIGVIAANIADKKSTHDSYALCYRIILHCKKSKDGLMSVSHMADEWQPEGIDPSSISANAFFLTSKSVTDALGRYVFDGFEKYGVEWTDGIVRFRKILTHS